MKFKLKFHTLVKGVIWEAIGMVILATGIWITTGNLYATGTIGIVYPMARALLFYPYERMWKRIRWCRTPEKIKIEIVARNYITRVIDLASKSIRTHYQIPVNATAPLIRSAFDEVIIDADRTPPFVVDYEALANRDVGFLVSKELLQVAKTNPAIVRGIKKALESQIERGGEHPARFQDEFQKSIPVQSVRRAIPQSDIRQATKDDGPPPLPPRPADAQKIDDIK